MTLRLCILGSESVRLYALLHEKAVICSFRSLLFATEADLIRVNALQKQVNDLHVDGRPDIFTPGFSDELRDHVYTIFATPDQKIVVCEKDGVLTGVAVLNHIIRPETPYMRVRDDLDIDEFCVVEAHCRSGIGTELMTFIRSYAKEKGFAKAELNMGEFNEDALRFYESVGFST